MIEWPLRQEVPTAAPPEPRGEPGSERLPAPQGAHRSPWGQSLPSLLVRLAGLGTHTVRRRQQSESPAFRFSTTGANYAGSGCGGEFMRANTWSHNWNRNSRKSARTAPQNSRREPNPARTR